MATTIQETFTLPSKGLLYAEKFNPNITLRSMTTEEEMKRLSYSDSEYALMSEIIDDCIVGNKPPISVYDMCLGDYQFLLHKLRTVTLGSEYKMYIQCSNCGEVVEAKVDLDSLTVLEFDPEKLEGREITLPISKKKVILSFQTPHMLDTIEERAKALSKKNKDNIDYRFLYLAMSFIKEIDGKELDSVMLENVVRKLPLRDVKYIIQKGDELNGKVGLDTVVAAKCPKCGYETVTTFRFGPEFWNPSFDD